MLQNIFTTIPTFMLMFLAALQDVPKSYYEAAALDGASRWQQFRHVTLPQLGPMLLVVGVITVSGYFQLFAEPYVMTRGDPLQSTVSVLYFMFEEGFKWWTLGRASAVAFLLFLIVLGVTTLLLRIGRRRGLV
jgi:multiple sugar transport system permease protein